MQGGKGGPVITFSAFLHTLLHRLSTVLRSNKRAILATERLEDRCKLLAERVDALESANKRLELEWIEAYDKIRHQLSRMARRGDLSNGKGSDANVDDAAPDDSVMDPISAKIHARRNRSFLGRQ